MVAEKRQIETHWEHNTGSASEAQQGVWKAEKCQWKGRRRMVRGRTEQRGGLIPKLYSNSSFMENTTISDSLYKC